MGGRGGSRSGVARESKRSFSQCLPSCPAWSESTWISHETWVCVPALTSTRCTTWGKFSRLSFSIHWKQEGSIYLPELMCYVNSIMMWGKTLQTGNHGTHTNCSSHNWVRRKSVENIFWIACLHNCGMNRWEPPNKPTIKQAPKNESLGCPHGRMKSIVLYHPSLRRMLFSRPVE